MSIITGMNRTSWQRMLLGPGVLIANLSLPMEADETIIRQIVERALADGQGVIGATRGGSRFRCTPKVHRLEEGYRTPGIDNTVVDSWRVRMTGTMMEFSPVNMATAMAYAAVYATPEMTVLHPGREGKAHFFDTLYWVGNTACGYVLIELINALNCDGAELTINEQQEGAMAFTFEAHMNGPQHIEEAPCRIILLGRCK